MTLAKLRKLPELETLVPKLLAAAQKEYDEWDADSDPENGDAEVGFGGICDRIAEAFCEVFFEAGFNSATVNNGGMGEQHVWAVVETIAGVVSVDIPAHYYETGGGYQWKKIKGVTFTRGFLVIHCCDPDPKNFLQYVTGD